MKKKKYIAPELDVTRFQLSANILLASREYGQTSSASGEMVDPNPDEEPISIGGID